MKLDAARINKLLHLEADELEYFKQSFIAPAFELGAELGESLRAKGIKGIPKMFMLLYMINQGVEVETSKMSEGLIHHNKEGKGHERMVENLMHSIMINKKIAEAIETKMRDLLKWGVDMYSTDTSIFDPIKKGEK